MERSSVSVALSFSACDVRRWMVFIAAVILAPGLIRAWAAFVAIERDNFLRLAWSDASSALPEAMTRLRSSTSAFASAAIAGLFAWMASTSAMSSMTQAGSASVSIPAWSSGCASSVNCAFASSSVAMHEPSMGASEPGSNRQ